jgi:imidazolonepropionase
LSWSFVLSTVIKSLKNQNKKKVCLCVSKISWKKMKARLRVLNANQLVTVVSDGAKFRRGADQNKVDIIESGAIVVDLNGKISMVGTTEEIKQKTQGWSFEEADIDAKGKCVLPGFVDAHTHPVWSGDRCHEFHLKLAGATYMDIAKMGGGIGFTTECTRTASEEELYTLLVQRLKRMIKFGTTTLEGKSGYGLNTETELKMLRVLTRANRFVSEDDEKKRFILPRIVSNFCGAHSVPKGLTAEQGTRLVVDEMIPAVAEAKKNGSIDCTLIDVFCETGVYNAEQTKEICEAGRHVANLEPNFHGDELTPMKSGELAFQIGARAVAHCEHVTIPEGIEAMAKLPTVGVLLPTTAYVLRITPPPARKMIEGNVPIALGSDFCPNAHSMSMPHTMNLACVTMKMTVNEALVAATINAAYSLAVADEVGSLEVGKSGDLILLDAPKWEHIVYQMVDPPIEAVFRGGFKIY